MSKVIYSAKQLASFFQRLFEVPPTLEYQNSLGLKCSAAVVESSDILALNNCLEKATWSKELSTFIPIASIGSGFKKLNDLTANPNFVDVFKRTGWDISAGVVGDVEGFHVAIKPYIHFLKISKEIADELVTANFCKVKPLAAWDVITRLAEALSVEQKEAISHLLSRPGERVVMVPFSQASVSVFNCPEAILEPINWVRVSAYALVSNWTFKGVLEATVGSGHPRKVLFMAYT